MFSFFNAIPDSVNLYNSTSAAPTLELGPAAFPFVEIVGWKALLICSFHKFTLGKY